MTTIVTRAGKGSMLTHAEVDANFTNLKNAVDNPAITPTTINNLTVGQGGGAIALNTALGTNALAANVGGVGNVAVGYGAMVANTFGDQGVAVGQEALAQNTSGDRNTGVGYWALTTTTTGNDNTALGSSAKALAATDDNSIIIGSQAIGLGSNTTAIGNSSTTRSHLFGVLTQPAYLVVTLPAAASAPYARSFVTDSTVVAAGNFGAIVAGGAGNVVPVYSDGVNWRIG